MSDVDASIEIKIAPNGIKATANYIPPQGEGKVLTVEDVLSKLDSLGVTDGIKHDHIDTICVSDKPMINIIIAEATQPQVGKKAQIMQYFEINKLNKAQEREDGGVDFRDLGEISSALKDQELYRRIPPTIGDPGKDVFGEEIPGISGRDLKLVVDHGTKVDENDPNLIRAAHDGKIIIKNGVVQVLKVHKINGEKIIRFTLTDDNRSDF